MGLCCFPFLFANYMCSGSFVCVFLVSAYLRNFFDKEKICIIN